MILLLLKLWIVPNVKLFIRKIFLPTSWLCRLIDQQDKFNLIKKLDDQAIQINKLQLDYQIMFTRINTLMKLFNASSIEQTICSTTPKKQTDAIISNRF